MRGLGCNTSQLSLTGWRFPRYWSRKSALSRLFCSGSDRSGFSITAPIDVQSRVLPRHLAGCFALAADTPHPVLPAALYLHPRCRSLRVTKRIRLCRCSSLYKAIKSLTHSLAASTLAKPSEGHCGLYFSVRNNDSEYGLSLLTLGLPREGVMPKSCILVRSVTDFIGAPLSEYSNRWYCQHCSRITLRCNNISACSPLSCSCTSQPTPLRL